MALEATLARLLDDAQRLDGPRDVYELARVRGASSASRRVDLVLALLQQVAGAVLITDDNPAVDLELPGTWAALGPRQWRMPDVPLDLGELLDELSAGNWQLVGFKEAERVNAVPAIDLMHEPDAAAELAASVGACWVIDVFHDDEPWRLALL